MANTPSIGVYNGLSGGITPKMGFLLANSKMEPICTYRNTQGLPHMHGPLLRQAPFRKPFTLIACNVDAAMQQPLEAVHAASGAVQGLKVPSKGKDNALLLWL